MSVLLNVLKTRWYWVAISLLGVTLLGVALYYQYALGDEPCQVCIQARLWVAGFTLSGAILAMCPQNKPLRLLGHTSVLVAAIGLAERSRFLYLLENGIGDGSCEFFLGMPDWFAVDRWVPWLFEVRNLCSYTPTMLLGLSMAETLMGLALMLAIGAVAVAVLDMRQPQAD